MNHTFILSYASPVPTFSITFIGSDDYRDGSIPVTFEALTTTATVPVTIFDDEVAECPEEFFLDLEIPEAAAAIGAIKGSADSATVSIIDNEGEYCSNAVALKTTRTL